MVLLWICVTFLCLAFYFLSLSFTLSRKHKVFDGHSFYSALSKRRYALIQCVYKLVKSDGCSRFRYGQRIQNQNSITTWQKKSFMCSNNFREQEKKTNNNSNNTTTEKSKVNVREAKKKNAEQNCRYKMPILNFISITIRNTRLYRPLQSKIWAFTIYCIEKKIPPRTNDKKHTHREREKKPIHEKLLSFGKAVLTYNRIQLLFAYAEIFSFFFPHSHTQFFLFSGTIMNRTEESNTKSVVKMKFIVQLLDVEGDSI